MTATSSSKDMIALDFDGVLCASAKESSLSAIYTAQQLWPTIMKSTIQNQTQLEQIIEILQQVRPVVEVGYDGVLLARYIYDQVIHLQIFTPTQIIQHILEIWNVTFREELLEYYSTNQYALTDAFGKTRDQLIANNLSDWVSLNSIYPHILQYFQHSIQATSSPADVSPLRKEQLFIITTKQERFVRAILEANQLSSIFIKEGRKNSLPFTEVEEDELMKKHGSNKQQSSHSIFHNNCNIFDLENIYGSKLNVLTELLHQYREGPDELLPTIHFVEDRYETLLNIKRHRDVQRRRRRHPDGKGIDLDHLKLYLVDWGYNTEKQRQSVQREEKEEITLLSPSDFFQLLEKIKT